MINARTDLYLERIGDPATRFERTCERLQIYADAGADCVFVPGVTDEDTIRRFVEALQLPLNVLAMAGTPPVRQLQELGVARVSTGSGLARACLGLARRISQDLKAGGAYDAMLGVSWAPPMAGMGLRYCLGVGTPSAMVFPRPAGLPSLQSQLFFVRSGPNGVPDASVPWQPVQVVLW